MRITVKNILVEPVEGPYADSFHNAPSFTEANAILAQLSQDAPTLGYHKVDYRIDFHDGNSIYGRYDLKHHSIVLPDLLHHIAVEINFDAGRYCPNHMTLEQYENYVNEHPAAVKWNTDFLNHYNVPFLSDEPIVSIPS